MQYNQTPTTFLDIDLIFPGYFQPRKHFNQQSLEALADTVRTQGVIQPLIVRPHQDHVGCYEIIAGERRWRAAQIAQLSQVPVVVRKINDQEALQFALVENIQREELTPVEESKAIARLVAEFALTHLQIAKMLGRSRESISNLLRLLQLSPRVLEFMDSGVLTMGHAKVLLGLEEKFQLKMAQMTVSYQWSVNRLTRQCKLIQKSELLVEKSSTTPSIDINLISLEAELTLLMGNSVHINCKKKGNGTVEISFNNLDELDGVLTKLGYQQTL